MPGCTALPQKSDRGRRWKKLKRRESFLSAVRHEIFVDRKDSLMFLAHLWATGYAAPPELRIHWAALFYKYVAATRLGAFALGFGAKPTHTKTHLPPNEIAGN